MDSLIKALSELLAAILRGLGFVGRLRRRLAIAEDLKLLRELEQCSAVGEMSQARQDLVSHIEREVAVYVGVMQPTQKKSWGDVVAYLVFGAGLAYLTYVHDKHGFHWYSVFPAFFAIGWGRMAATHGSRVWELSQALDPFSYARAIRSALTVGLMLVFCHREVY
jgi:hypothetical protein